MGNWKIENGHTSQVTLKKEKRDYMNLPIVVIQDYLSCYMLHGSHGPGILLENSLNLKKQCLNFMEKSLNT